ncbi:phosphoenolpyruvate hydrolase family protein [Elioraea sp.]|uniref:phosphoenolpyruvate hydrolase family protein n=1 Tax=Elioraea sp. TaxID=2185103 RepID=UPI0025C0E464|nr:phosphoenolpyruvate hydrolase family protein [Elioraea sp.]
MVRTLHPLASLAGVRPERRRDGVFLPALAQFPPARWPLVALLPVLDINGALLAACRGRARLRAGAPVAGVFASDPFLRVADVAAALAEAGITEVVNFPTIQFFGPETSAALASVGMRAEAEFRMLLRFAEHGMAPIACAVSDDAATIALSLGLRRILLHPGLGEGPARPWPEQASHVLIEGGEPFAWRDAADSQLSRPSRRIRL